MATGERFSKHKKGTLALERRKSIRRVLGQSKPVSNHLRRLWNMEAVDDGGIADCFRS